MWRTRCQMTMLQPRIMYRIHAFTTTGGVVSGDIKLSVSSDLVTSLGCNDLSAGKKFTLLLGQTQIC